MTEVVLCGVCGSLVSRDQVDGKCYTCGRNCCQNCKRICDRCQLIYCMFDIEAKLVRREQQPVIHKLCEICSQIWQ